MIKAGKLQSPAVQRWGSEQKLLGSNPGWRKIRGSRHTVFDSFPWPQEPTLPAVKAVAVAAVALREKRRELCEAHGLTLRELYKSMEVPGDHPLKAATTVLDDAVRRAYGMAKKDNPLEVLLTLNLSLAEIEKNGGTIRGPGLPSFVNDVEAFITDDAITS